MLFRRKPIVVEAWQYFHSAHKDDLTQAEIEGNKHICLCRAVQFWPKNDPLSNSYFLPHVHTLEGPLTVSEGDWIITGVNGEHYPCKPDVFEKTYEAVTQDDLFSNRLQNLSEPYDSEREKPLHSVQSAIEFGRTAQLLQSATRILASVGLSMSIETAVQWAMRILDEVDEQTSQLPRTESEKRF